MAGSCVKKGSLFGLMVLSEAGRPHPVGSGDHVVHGIVGEKQNMRRHEVCTKRSRCERIREGTRFILPAVLVIIPLPGDPTHFLEN